MVVFVLEGSFSAVPSGAAVPVPGAEGGHRQGEDVLHRHRGLPPLLGTPLCCHPRQLALALRGGKAVHGP